MADSNRRKLAGRSLRRRPVSNYSRSGGQTVRPGGSPFRPEPKESGRSARDFFTRLADLFLLALVLFGLVYSLLLSSDPRLHVSSTAYNSYQNYYDSAKRHLKPFKDRNKISFDEQSVINGLMGDHPEINSVSIELPVFSEHPVINISVSSPSFILAKGGHDYLIDAEGKAIGFANNFRLPAKLPKITDESNYDINFGKSVLSSSDVAFIDSLLAEAKASSVSFDWLTLPNRPEELDARPKGEPYFVKFDLRGNIAVEIGQFLAAKKQFDSGGGGPAEYLDVRVAGKIFYK